MYSPKRRFRLFRSPAFNGGTPGSILFNGTTDALSYTGVVVGTSQFTAEGWFRQTSFSARSFLFGADWTGSNRELSISTLSATEITVDWLGVGAQTYTVPSLSTDTWYHFAVVRNGTNNLRVFLNGVESTTTGITNTVNFAKTSLIGAWNSGGEGNRNFFPGYLSNLRIVVGTAVYTAPFTVPTAPLTAISGTQLLLNTTTSNYLTDSSPNEYVMTPIGTPSPSALTPF